MRFHCLPSTLIFLLRMLTRATRYLRLLRRLDPGTIKSSRSPTPWPSFTLAIADNSPSTVRHPISRRRVIRLLALPVAFSCADAPPRSRESQSCSGATGVGFWSSGRREEGFVLLFRVRRSWVEVGCPRRLLAALVRARLRCDGPSSHLRRRRYASVTGRLTGAGRSVTRESPPFSRGQGDRP